MKSSFILPFCKRYLAMIRETSGPVKKCFQIKDKVNRFFVIDLYCPASFQLDVMTYF